jgi:hypothetical protein
MVVLSALMSAGIVSTYDYVVARYQEPVATIQVSHRFPVTNETMKAVALKPAAPLATSAGKADRQPSISASCAKEEWPYLSQGCLVSADGQPTRSVSRVITVERKVGTMASELTRVPITEIAHR